MNEPPSLINWFNKDRMGQDIGGFVRNLGQRHRQLALNDGGGYGETWPHL